MDQFPKWLLQIQVLDDPDNTDILVSAAGLGAKFEAQIAWNVNLLKNFTEENI